MPHLRPSATPGALALLLLVAGCGSAVVDDPALPAGTPETYDAVQRHGQELTDSIRGTVAERAAAEFLATHALNAPTADCMTAAGLTWAPPQLSVQAVAPIEPFANSTWLRQPLRRSASEHVRFMAPLGRVGDEPIAGSTRAYEQVLTACLDQTAGEGPSDDRLGDPGARRLEEATWAFFTKLVREVDEPLGSPEEYAECMVERGTDMTASTDGLEGYLVVQRRLIDAAPAADVVPLDGDPVDPAWSDFLAEEEQTLLDDQACRASAYAAGVRSLRPALERFAADHARELDDLDAHWQGVLARARAEGFVATALQESDG